MFYRNGKWWMFVGSGVLVELPHQGEGAITYLVMYYLAPMDCISIEYLVLIIDSLTSTSVSSSSATDPLFPSIDVSLPVPILLTSSSAFMMNQDIPLQITSPNTSSERRIPVSWTIARLKAKLEPVTGIPPSAQRLVLRRGAGGGAEQSQEVIEAPDEENTTLEGWNLGRGMEIYVSFKGTSVGSEVAYDVDEWTTASFLLFNRRFARLFQDLL